jgi:hypothetical protein
MGHPRKSRFLDSAGSSAFADDPAALEMTMGNWKPQWYVTRKGQRTRADNAVWLGSASNIPTLNFAKNAKFRMGHPARDGIELVLAEAILRSERQG